MPTKSRRGKSAVFRMYSSLTSHGSSKIYNAVGRQRNLGLTTPFRNNLRITYASSQIIGKPDNLKVCGGKKTRRPTPQAHMARNTLLLFLLIFLLTYLFSITCLLFHLFFLSDTNTTNKGKSYEIIKKFY